MNKIITTTFNAIVLLAFIMVFAVGLEWFTHDIRVFILKTEMVVCILFILLLIYQKITKI
jgi:hypothetical protein